MPQVGGYETVAKIAPGAVGAVYSARVAGTSDAPVFAVKLFTPDVAVIGDEEAEAHVAAFLARVEAQRRIYDAVGVFGGWARIVDSGRLTEDVGAYCVLDLAQSSQASLERMWRSRAIVDHPTLAMIVGLTAYALDSGRKAAGRGHGNLKPGNVLLLPPTEGSAIRVALSDPLPDGDAKIDGGELRDQRALGAIIYTLVQHQPPKNVWIIQDQRLWNTLLGREAPKWIELVQQLLDPSDELARPTLGQIAERYLRDAVKRQDSTKPTAGSKGQQSALDLRSGKSGPVPVAGSKSGAVPVVKSGGVPARRDGVSAGEKSGAVPAAGKTEPKGLGSGGHRAAGSVDRTADSIAAEVVAEAEAAAAGSSDEEAGASVESHELVTPGNGNGKSGGGRRGAFVGVGVAAVVALGVVGYVMFGRGSVPAVPPVPNPNPVPVVVTPPVTDEGISKPVPPSIDPNPGPKPIEVVGNTPEKPPVPAPREPESADPSSMSIEKAKTTANTRVPELNIPPEQVPTWAKAMISALTTERADRVARALKVAERGGSKSVGAKPLERELGVLETELVPRLQAAEKFLPPLTAVEKALDEGFGVGVDDAVPQTGVWGQTAKELAGNAEWNALAKPVVDRVQLLARLKSESDAVKLANAATAASVDHPEVGVYVWKRLMAMGLPRQAADLTTLGRTRGALEQSASGMRNKERQQAILSGVKREATAGWTALVKAAKSPEELVAAMDGRAGMGIGDEDMTPEMRVNEPLARLLAAVNVKQDQQTLKEAMSKFDMAMKSVVVDAALAKRVNESVSALKAIASREPPKPVAGPEGPLGVVPDGETVGARVGNVTLRFRRISVNGEDSYIGVNEVTVGEVSAIVGSANSWAEFGELLKGDNVNQDPIWEGPRSWRWLTQTQAIGPNTEWFNPSGLSREDRAAGKEYPPGMTKAVRPSTNSPMNAIPAAAAAFVAQKIRCRLPTKAEFAEVRKVGGQAVGPVWDQSLDAMANHQQLVLGTALASEPPSPGAAGAGVFQWFRDEPAAGDQFVDVVGNVAEFVCDRKSIVREGNKDAMSAAMSAACDAKEVAAAGGSRFKRPNAPDAPVTDALTGYSDVGFRLAFSAPPKAPVVDVTQEINTARSGVRLLSMQ